MTQTTSIPVLLLKTRSIQDDSYEESFSQDDGNDSITFDPHFVPVLAHERNESALASLATWLETGELKRKYGGMIFTSQRAVEAWTEVVVGLNAAKLASTNLDAQRQATASNPQLDPFANLESLLPFPLYVVGPATERALQSLANREEETSSIFYTALNATIHGADTGNGANLAAFILKHYNQLYYEHWFNSFEAPRLPFIPLLGMSSENYGRKRLEANDARLQKKPLLFLVGEQRRDVIPKTLQDPANESERIMIDELEVYRTEVMKDFENDFASIIGKFESRSASQYRIVVVFSPQGVETMLRTIGFLDSAGKATEQASKRWCHDGSMATRGIRWVIVTIGPTTRAFLKDGFGIEPEVCATRPNPQSLRADIHDFLKQYT